MDVDLLLCALGCNHVDNLGQICPTVADWVVGPELSSSREGNYTYLECGRSSRERQIVGKDLAVHRRAVILP